MKIENLLSKPVWQMTGEELLFLSRHSADTTSHTDTTKETPPEKRYVYGIAGICEIFRCALFKKKSTDRQSFLIGLIFKRVKPSESILQK